MSERSCTMLSRLARRFSIRSTKFFLLLTGASAIFVYLVSPLRNPDFGKIPRPYAGEFIWWLQGVQDDHWELGAIILAGLLAINLTLDLWQWCKSQTFLAAHQHRNCGEQSNNDVAQILNVFSAPSTQNS